MPNPSLVWFRRDLRLHDNPAFTQALKKGGPIIPLFLWAPEEEKPWQPGEASKWWLHYSLMALDKSLRSLGSRLILRALNKNQKVDDQLASIIAETDADALFFNRSFDPALIKQEVRVQKRLSTLSIHINISQSSYVHNPFGVKSGQGTPYRVYTPFSRALESLPLSRPSTLLPKKLEPVPRWPRSISIDDLKLKPNLKWANSFSKYWQPGEEGAQKHLRSFIKNTFSDYKSLRDIPSVKGTSRLSPHLHFGEISPNQIIDAVSKHQGPAQYRKEIYWREFAMHLLTHFPHTPLEPLRENFKRFPWQKNNTWLRRWQKGMTGYPIVDAGMRELWTTGWMHNRVRMIVASFLVKDLRLSWVEGAKWFWDTLVDADLANNTLGWQWSAGCGADAAPYFRVFNLVLQGEKFDPQGVYVRRWIPELAKLPNRYIHEPWETPLSVLIDAQVQLGHTYPKPLVNHNKARISALVAFQSITK